MPFVFGYNLHPQFQRAFDPPRPAAVVNALDQQLPSATGSANTPQVAAIPNAPQLVADTRQVAVNGPQLAFNASQVLATQVAAQTPQVVSNNLQVTANTPQVVPSQIVSNTPEITATTPQASQVAPAQVLFNTPQITANTSQVPANTSHLSAAAPQAADNVSLVVTHARQVLIKARQALATAGRRVVTPPISANITQVITNASKVLPKAPTTDSSHIVPQPASSTAPSLPRPLPPIPTVSQQTSSTPADKTKAVIPTALTVSLSAQAQVLPRGDSKGKTKAAVTRTAVPLPSPRPGPRRGRQSIAVKCHRRSSGNGEVGPPCLVVVSRGDGASSTNLKRPREEGEQDLGSQVKRHCGTLRRGEFFHFVLFYFSFRLTSTTFS